MLIKRGNLPFNSSSSVSPLFCLSVMVLRVILLFPVVSWGDGLAAYEETHAEKCHFNNSSHMQDSICCLGHVVHWEGGWGTKRWITRRGSQTDGVSEIWEIKFSGPALSHTSQVVQCMVDKQMWRRRCLCHMYGRSLQCQCQRWSYTIASLQRRLLGVSCDFRFSNFKWEKKISGDGFSKAKR